MAKSTGLHVHDLTAIPIIDHVWVPTKISFFCFPQDQSQRNAWSNLIKRRENKDSSRISKFTQVCEKHFLPETIDPDSLTNFIPSEQLYLN